MSTLAIPYSFTPGTTAQSGQVNADFAAVVTAVNNIDNTNVGSLGFYASQLKPLSTGQATFGGSFGYTFYPGASGQVPLTVSGVAGQSVDIFDITLTSGGTKEVWVDSSGVLHTAQAPIFGGTSGYVQLSPSSQQSGSINVSGSIQSGAATIAALGSAFQLELTDTTGAAPTPNKYLRVSSGQFGIVNSAFTTQILTLTDAGALSIPGTFLAGGSVVGGTTGGFTYGSSGDVYGSSGASSGGLWLGGTGAHFGLDFGETTSGVATASGPLTVTGKLIASASISNNGTSITGAFDVPNGDIHVSRNGTGAGSSGFVFFGPYGNYFNNDGAGGFSWSGNNAGTQLAALSNTGALAVKGNSSTLGYVPPVYSQNGVSGGASTHIVIGSGTGTGGSQTITLSGSAVFSSAASYAVTVGTTGSQNLVSNGSGSYFTIQVTNGSPYTWIAVGS